MEVGLVGTEPLSEMLPTPIRQKLSPPVAMERDTALPPVAIATCGCLDRKIAGL